MCGILGSIPPLPKEKFKKALDELLHRGPDSYGIKVVGDNAILGHRRLSIIDLSKQADQPMQDITKRYTLIFNGEIYNFLELRSELLKKGHNFQTNSDSEVLLYAYIQWGSDCLKKLNGMWSFAIYDSLKKEIFLSRDRFGKKPLFYLHDSNRFIFASEMKALFPFMNDVSMSPNFQALKKNIFGYDHVWQASSFNTFVLCLSILFVLYFIMDMCNNINLIVVWTSTFCFHFFFTNITQTKIS